MRPGTAEGLVGSPKVQGSIVRGRAEPAAGARHLRAAAVGVTAVAILVVSAVLGARSTPDRAPGKFQAAAVDLENVRPGDRRVTLASFHGKPVVMNFWASWCVPCRREMPALNAVSEAMAGRVAFLGVNHRDGRRQALDFLSESGVRYPSGYDPEGGVAPLYGLPGLPTTVFIGPDGQVLLRHTGELSRSELERAIDALFFSG